MVITNALPMRDAKVLEKMVITNALPMRDAKVLEKMVITNALPMRDPKPNMLLKSLRVALMLLNFPRSSPHAVVTFPYH